MDSNSTTAVRSILSELSAWTEEQDLLGILVSHYNKDESKTAKTRVLGSIGFVAGVRSAVGVYRDLADETRERRLFVPFKCNLVPERERTGLAFVIKRAAVTDGEVTGIEAGYVDWLDETITQTADDVIRAQCKKGAELSAARKAIIAVLSRATAPLSGKKIAEDIHGRPMEDKNDQDWKNTRKHLAEMARDELITKDDDGRYSLPDRAKTECPKCNGTGVLTEYEHRDDGKCYACNGRGWFFAPIQDPDPPTHPGAPGARGAPGAPGAPNRNREEEIDDDERVWAGAPGAPNKGAPLNAYCDNGGSGAPGAPVFCKTCMYLTPAGGCIQGQAVRDGAHECGKWRQKAGVGGKYEREQGADDDLGEVAP